MVFQRHVKGAGLQGLGLAVVPPHALLRVDQQTVALRQHPVYRPEELLHGLHVGAEGKGVAAAHEKAVKAGEAGVVPLPDHPVHPLGMPRRVKHLLHDEAVHGVKMVAGNHRALYPGQMLQPLGFAQNKLFFPPQIPEIQVRRAKGRRPPALGGEASVRVLDLLRQQDAAGGIVFHVLVKAPLPLILGDLFQDSETFRGLGDILHTFTTRLIFQRISMFAVRFLACRLPMAIRCVVSSAERAMCHSV